MMHVFYFENDALWRPIKGAERSHQALLKRYLTRGLYYKHQPTYSAMDSALKMYETIENAKRSVH